MAETVGTKTKQKTSAGKDVYKTPEGESVSEKSVTIKFGDGAYVNAPSIHEGKQYTEDEIKKMLLEGIIKPTSRHDTLEEAIESAEKRSDNLLKDGGMAKRMAEQMELFEPVERGFDEGGLMDEGGTVDPVSGNDVPPGSTQEEVRDDIPAQLSEGEFVFPADVVRYIGLENLMRMRQEAKQGLAQMDAMGQMGNSEEATVEDDLPFDMYDLDVEDERNFNVGGYVNPQTGTYKMPGTGITGFQQAPASTTGVTANQSIQPYFKPTQFTETQYQDPLKVTNIPTFAETVGTGFGQYDEIKTYVNDAGQVMKIPFKDGKPIYPIPEGYRPQEDQPTAEQPTTPVTTTPVTNQGGDGGDNIDYGGGTSLLTGEKIAGHSPEEIKSGVASAKDRYAVTGNRGIDLLNILPGGMLLKNLLGVGDESSMALFSNTPEAMPTGLTDSDGNMIPSASADYMKSLGGLPSTDKMTVTTRTSGSPLPNTNVLPASAPTVRNIQSLRERLGVTPTRYVGFQKGDLDPNSGGFFDKNGIAVDAITGDQTKNESGTFNYSSLDDFQKAFSAGNESGWRGGKVGKESYSKLSGAAKSKYNTFAEIMNYDDHIPDYTSDDGQKAPPGGYAGYSGEDVEASYDPGPGDSSSDNNNDGGGGQSASDTSDGGGGGMGGGFGSQDDGFGGGD
jgi:hypothetical protein